MRVNCADVLGVILVKTFCNYEATPKIVNLANIRTNCTKDALCIDV